MWLYKKIRSTYEHIGFLGSIASILGLFLFVTLAVVVPVCITGSATSNVPPPVGLTTPTSTPTFTPTPVFTPTQPPFQWVTPDSSESLKEMLEAAKRVRRSTAQGQALRIVAQHAVRMGNYGIAIDAGQATYSSSAGSETLEFVAVCAAKKGNFEYATKAAKEIPSTSIHDKTTIEILKIKSEQDANQGPEPYLAKSGPTATPEGCP